MYKCIGKSNVYVIFDCINWRDTLLLGTHDFGGTTPRVAWRRINIPTLQSYRLWSLLSARQWVQNGTTPCPSNTLSNTEMPSTAVSPQSFCRWALEVLTMPGPQVGSWRGVPTGVVDLGQGWDSSWPLIRLRLSHINWMMPAGQVDAFGDARQGSPCTLKKELTGQRHGWERSSWQKTRIKSKHREGGMQLPSSLKGMVFLYWRDPFVSVCACLSVCVCGNWRDGGIQSPAPELTEGLKSPSGRIHFLCVSV